MWPDRRMIDFVGIDNPDSNGGIRRARRERVRTLDKLPKLTRFQCSKV